MNADTDMYARTQSNNVITQRKYIIGRTYHLTLAHIKVTVELNRNASNLQRAAETDTGHSIGYKYRRNNVAEAPSLHGECIRPCALHLTLELRSHTSCGNGNTTGNSKVKRCWL